MLTIHKASAGSGKTYALTYRYIKLLLGTKDPADGSYRLSVERDRHRAILAITFTNKATEEMKRRIVQQLARLARVPAAGGVRSDYEERLCRELSCDADRLADRARRALNSLLADFGRFNVSTIDAFFQTVLRAFAREAELNGNYEVQLTDRDAYKVGVDEMLSSVNRESADRGSGDRYLTRWLTQYMESLIKDGKDFNVFNRGARINDSLVRFVSSALSETYKINSETIAAYLARPELMTAFVQQVARLVKHHGDMMVTSCRDALDVFASRGMTDRLSRYLRMGLEAYAEGRTGKEPTATMIAAVDNADKRYAAKFRGTVDGDLDAAVTRALVTSIESFNARKLLVTVRNNVYNLGLLGHILTEVENYRRENDTILLSDTNDLLRRIINEDEAPFIYERLGIELRHFLIDEFQDTSRLQWANLSALVRESLANGNDNLVIGDEKQAIYRFRNSDSELLRTDVPREFGRQSEVTGDSSDENTNWRSAPEVVRFNNTVFTFLAPMLGLDDIYGNVVQNISPRNIAQPGYVDVQPYSQGDSQAALDRMVAEIKRELAAGFRQSDIVVLVDTHPHGAAVIDRLLAAKIDDPELADLRVLSEDSLAIGHSQAVRLVVSVLRMLDTPQSDNPDQPTAAEKLARIVNRYHYFHSLGLPEDEALERALEADDLTARIAAEAAEMVCVNLQSVIERVIRRYLSPAMLNEQNVYISAFQDLVSDFCSQGEADLHSFLRWWDESGSQKSISTPPRLNAVRVMTIHKSKGLEFECVHLPLVGWKMSTSKDLVWFDTRDSSTGSPIREFAGIDPEVIPPFIPLQSQKGLCGTSFENQYLENLRKENIDRLNLTYVAFTRAVSELIVSYEAPSGDGNAIGGLLKRVLHDATPQCIESIDDGRKLLVPLTDGHSDSATLGQPVRPSHSDDSDEGTLQPMPPYYAHDNDRIWDMSRIEDLAEMSRPRQRGIVLHDIMSSVVTRGDIHKAVLRRVTRGFIDPDEVADYEAELTRALANEEVRPWFEGFRKVLRERNVAVNDSHRRQRHYRPDRVVWTAEGTIDVIDYKFGNEEPSRYRRQVAGYVKLLERIYAGAEVRGFLWYPLTDTITRV